MLLLLLPAKFRGKINLPDKVVVYVNPLDAVAAGLVGLLHDEAVLRIGERRPYGGTGGRHQEEGTSFEYAL